MQDLTREQRQQLWLTTGGKLSKRLARELLREAAERVFVHAEFGSHRRPSQSQEPSGSAHAAAEANEAGPLCAATSKSRTDCASDATGYADSSLIALPKSATPVTGGSLSHA